MEVKEQHPPPSCPMSLKNANPFISASNNMPIVAEQAPSTDQKSSLSTDRVASSIPKAETMDTWLYPSQQMFYNAMKRKGYSPSEKDMDVVVPIHNMVNEQAWVQVCKYEKLHQVEYGAESKGPKLIRFVGKPDDMSPKARILSWLGFTPPFDRHDWYVDRNGREIRYVIDFYQGQPRENSLVSIHLDVRPEVSISGIIDRFRMGFSDMIKSL